MTIQATIALITAFAEIEELPHFEKRSFRVNKKIVAALDEAKETLTVKLTPIEQSSFMAFDATIIYPASGKWGQSGYTIIDLKRVHPETLSDAVRCSYCNVAPKKLADLYRNGVE